MTVTDEQKQRKILIADDDDGVRNVLHDLLTDEGYRVTEVRSGTEVLTKIAGGNGYDLLLMDVRMPGIDGLEVLERLQKNNSDLGVIMITAHATSSVAIRAMQMGAFDQLRKPFEVDEVLVTVQRYFEHQELASKVKTLESQSFDPRDRMIGSGPAMQRIYKTIGRIAGSDATVLVTGETGTGKELVANVIHAHSSRRTGPPMVRVNCAALPDTLLESELFGHEKGAFTSAVSQRKGRFELANKSTIFLDEVGELSLTAQKKLLRVLQEGEFERVGGTATMKVDVRVITATNRDIEEEVRKGNFREDLYYRLNVINIHMPSLRERREDIPLLIEHFLDKYRYSPSSPPSQISEEAINKLIAYDWPGNVRQLENEMQRAVVLSQGKVITSELLSLEPGTAALAIDIASAVRERRTLAQVLRDVECTMLTEALRQHDGDHAVAADRLGLSTRAFAAKLKELGIE